MSLRLFIVSLLSAVLFYLPAQAELSRGEQQEVREIIRAYLVENPELLRDVLTDLAMREEEEALNAALEIARQDEADGLMGNPDGDVTIYEFSDYNCGYCKRVFTALREVLEDDPMVELRVKEFPILAESSVIAARAGLAAQRQGKFADFHTIMMTAVGGITPDSITAAAEDAGLDMKQFNQDMNDPAMNEVLGTNSALARQLDLSGTPALIIGNVVIPGAISAEQIKELVASVRAEQNS